MSDKTEVKLEFLRMAMAINPGQQASTVSQGITADLAKIMLAISDLPPSQHRTRAMTALLHARDDIELALSAE